MRRSHEFPVNGDYEITIRLSRDRNEHVEGLLESHEVELLLDDQQVQLFTVAPPSLGPDSRPPIPRRTRRSTAT